MNTRQQLLECALKLFSQRGYYAVAVQDIVEAAGVTKPTLYHYFNSKRGLLDALLQQEFSSMLSKILEAAHYKGDLIVALENTTCAYFDHAQKVTAFYRMQLAMYFSPPESETYQAIRPYTKQQLEILTDLFIHATEQHGNLRGRHTRYAAGFLGVVNAMINLYLDENLSLSEMVVYQTVHQFMHGIFS